MSEVKVPPYLDVEHLENMYLQMRMANDRNMAEKIKLSTENKALREALEEIGERAPTLAAAMYLALSALGKEIPDDLKFLGKVK